MSDNVISKPNKTFSRREFISASGLAIAGLALAPSLSFAEQFAGRKSERKIRIGVVGGGFGSVFYWHQDPNCVVEAVSDLIPARREHLMNVYNCRKSYESLEKLILDKDVDAVAVFTGAPDHVKHCIAALKAGKHVICAVPAAMNIDEAEELLETVKRTGLTYMMAETSYYRQPMISARDFRNKDMFGNIFYTEAEYHHPGLDELYWDQNGSKTWRYGFPPMNYPTHCTSFLTGLTGERLTSVTCIGWGDDSPILKDNQYKNPFWNETAFFKTDKGNAFRVAVYWKGALAGTERAQWYGDKMSFFLDHPNGLPPTMIKSTEIKGKDEAGFVRIENRLERYEQVPWWKTSMLPEALRHYSGHDAAEEFLTHEFVDALVNERKPAVDIYEALAYTVPGIIAHKSALKGGEQLKVPVYDPKK
ncbi:MAG: Gfo/Idh/MocA family protein [Armatimonadota bacterium]